MDKYLKNRQRKKRKLRLREHARAPTPDVGSPGPSRAPTPNVSADQLPPTSMSLPNTTADDGDDDDQPALRGRVRRQLGPRALRRAKYVKRRKTTPEERAAKRTAKADRLMAKADKLRAKIDKERARTWKWSKDIVGRKIRIPKDMDAVLFFKMICAHKRTGRYPIQMIQYAPERIVAETCNICYQALRGTDVYFTKAQQARLRRMKDVITALAYKRLPSNVKRRIIQRGGFPFALLVPLIVKGVLGIAGAAASAGVGAAVASSMSR